MSRVPFSARLGLILALCLPMLAHAIPMQPLGLIPWPAQLQRSSVGVTIAPGTPIVVAGADAGTRASADYLRDLLARARGLDLPVTTTPPAQGVAIVLTRDPQAPVAHPDGYALDVDARGVQIRARDATGLFYGVVTLSQLATLDTGRGAAALPGVSIRDWPRFRWRGLMLDSARHMQSVAEIERLLDAMARLKLDVLHWHLTDDQGWRIQIKRYPELTRIGAWRTPPDAGRDGEPARYGGYYTQEQIRQIVAYAAARHIMVVPELDMPGHAQAAIASYPQFGVTGQRPPVSVDWGVNPYLYNVDDATFDFIDHVLDEVMALFPSPYIHVGGDEAIKDQWKASPQVQAKMHALGLKNEDQLQAWFIARVGRYLSAHGRKLVGWDEILEGGAPPGATVMSWRGTQGAIDAARAGHDVVLSPAPTLYLDSMESTLPDEMAGRTPIGPLSAYYAFEPVPKVLDAAQATHVLGAQANLWTEQRNGPAMDERAIFPRLAALAEVDWSPAAARNWHAFLIRLPAQLARWRAEGIAYADSDFAVAIDTDANAAISQGHARVTLSNQAGFGTLRYTVDGSTPTRDSTRYTGPFEVALPTTVRATPFDIAGQPLAAPRTREFSDAALRTRTTSELVNCPGSDFRLRVQPTPDATSLAPTYMLDVLNTCQRYLKADLDGVRAIHVEAARLMRNYALAGDQKLVVSRPRATPYGELVVHRDRCDGPVLASLPLPDPATSPDAFALDGALRGGGGIHDLCLIYTAPSDGPLYAIGSVALRTASDAPAGAASATTH